MRTAFARGVPRATLKSRALPGFLMRPLRAAFR